ncbi:MAG: Wadjet anti-phage system protein JetD domain-containing protein [Actinomycetota bacterium]
MPDAGRTEADALLGRLLTLVERKTEAERANRVMVRMAERSWLADEREDLYARLAAAEKTGAVMLEWGRNDSRHLIIRVVLKDAAALYRFLGRTPKAALAADALAELRARLPDHPAVLEPLLAALEDSWRRGRPYMGLETDDIAGATRCLQTVAVLVEGRLDCLDLRTFSRRATGDSKFVECHQGRIVDLLRQIVDAPDEMSAEDVLASHGIARYPQPCLLAGPITWRGQPLPTEPYIGIAPDMVTDLGVAGTPPWILTIENLASFNRQVREAAGTGIILYTGGFPSTATLDCLLTLARATPCPVYHWGDIDPGGIKIAYRLEQALATIDRPLRLHRMDAKLGRRHGQPQAGKPVFRMDISGSVVAGLATFLAGPDACVLEQEELDPVVPHLWSLQPADDLMGGPNDGDADGCARGDGRDVSAPLIPQRQQ